MAGQEAVEVHGEGGSGRGQGHARPHPDGKVALPKLSYLALLAPLSFAAHALGYATAAFPLAVLGLVGGAFLLGEASEVLGSRIGQGLGSLVTATLSNLVTILVVGAALFAGLYDVVAASVTGVILGTLLFALGGAMFLGGLGREKQTFNREAAGVNTTLLMVASFALLIPALAQALLGARAPDIGARITLPLAVLLIVVYLAGLMFSTRTHKHLFNPPTAAEHGTVSTFASRYPLPLLVGSVALVAMAAETFASSLEPVSAGIGLSGPFIGIFVVGVITDAVEISASWRAARRDRMHAALHVSTGSAIQAALFVAPILVFLSLLTPRMLSLQFEMTEVVAILMSAVLVNVVASDGESTWYEGVLLLSLYAILGLVFFFSP
ncbi:MAG: calcium/proton exchanger [Halobacteriales archaeon]|nr:calcium/proton exchanger [Halobacteriales archaeon]